MIDKNLDVQIKAETEPIPTCVVCHVSAVEPLCDVDGYTVYTCDVCSIDFVWPMPDQLNLKKLYDREEWFQGGEKGGYENYDEQTECLPHYLEEAFVEISGNDIPKAVLDIGCGYGTHLAAAAERGWQCVGIEVSEHARNIANERHGDSIYLLDGIEALPPGKFDLVLILDVIEHLADPYSLFFTLFKKGAIGPQTQIVITTPNAKSKDAMSDPANWAYRHPPSHLVYYSAQALSALLGCLKWNSVEIVGLHPLNGREVYPEDGKSQFNKKFKDYAGLLCTATGSDFTEFMHERYVPGTWNKITEYEHIPRYVMAQKLATGLKVMDFGCGTGYGSAMLAQKAESVLGVDISEEALQWAKHHHRSPHLQFDLRDDLGEALPEKSFDLITCFEMIEHVDQQTQELTIRNFSRLLGEKGALIISTPNPEVTANYGDNPYHLHEMSEKEFKALLTRYFSHVQIFKQWIRPSTLIAQHPLFSQGEGVRTCSVGVDGQSRELPAVAYIAICSDELLVDIEGVCNFDSSFDFVAKSIDDINYLNQTLTEKYSDFQRNRTNEMALSENQAILAKQTQFIQTLQDAISEKESAIQSMGEKFDEQARNIAELRGFISEKESNLEVQAIAIQTLQDTISEKESSIQSMDERFDEQARNINELRQDLEQRNNSILEKEVSLSSLKSSLRENEAILDQKEIRLIKKKQEIFAIKHELLDVKQSIPYQLNLLTKQKKYTLINLTKILYLVGGMVTPEWIKSIIKAILRKRKLTNQSNLEEGSTNAPYVIKPILPILETRPKVVHVIGNFITGGSSRLVADIIEHLGHFCEQEVLTAYNPEPVSYTGVPVHTCYPLTSPDKVLEYLEKYMPDMMHVHYWGYGDKPWYEQAILAGEKFGCKIIENVNTPVEPYWSDSVSKYVHVSDYVKMKFGKGSSDELTIYPGSNFELFSREQIKQVPDNCIGMVYRLEKDKLDEESINVFIEVAKRRPQTKMLIVGGGPFVELYSDAVNKAGVSSSFEFTGLVNYSRLPDLYRQMSIFVAPVVRESFGQVTPFAMSMGLPVAGYDVGALSEILGSKECLAPPQDSTQLAKIIISLLDDREKRIELGKFNRDRAHAKFSVEEMVRKYSVLYKEMLGPMK